MLREVGAVLDLGLTSSIYVVDKASRQNNILFIGIIT